MSTESELKRYRDQVSKLRSEVGRHSSTVATKRKKAADAMSAASRSRSDSTRRMKEREAEAATKDANTAEKSVLMQRASWPPRRKKPLSCKLGMRRSSKRATSDH